MNRERLVPGKASRLKNILGAGLVALSLGSSSPVAAQTAEQVPAFGSCSALGETPWKAEFELSKVDDLQRVAFPQTDDRPPEPVQCHIRANTEVSVVDNRSGKLLFSSLQKGEDWYGEYRSDEPIKLGMSVPNYSKQTPNPTPTIEVQRGILANSITREEQQALFESLRDVDPKNPDPFIRKWTGPIRIQLRRTDHFDTHSAMVDGLVNELSSLITLPVNRVASGANVIIDFVPVSTLPSGLWGIADFPPLFPSGNSVCRIIVAEDPEHALASYSAAEQELSPQQKTDFVLEKLRHEMGHCLGLGHNTSPESFMSNLFDEIHMAYYSRGSRADRYPDFDKALLQRLYHPSVKPGMRVSQVQDLFVPQTSR